MTLPAAGLTPIQFTYADASGLEDHSQFIVWCASVPREGETVRSATGLKVVRGVQHEPIKTPDGETLVRVTRGVSFFVSHVKVTDGQDQVVGGFKQKFFSIGGRFTVLDAQDLPVCTLQGSWTGWDFKFVAGTAVLAQVTKKWAGLGKELFTSADNYMLTIADSVRPDDPPSRRSSGRSRRASSPRRRPPSP